MGQNSVYKYILMKCRYCGKDGIKNGVQNNGSQRYKCKNCNRSQQQIYSYNAYLIDTDL
jgi:transposase-like protein